MKARTFLTVAAATSLLALAGCTEAPQGVGGTAAKADTAPHVGVGASQFVDSGWTQGDRTSWEQKLKTRTTYGQNEYTRTAN
ncbi:MAG: hypothetical protein MUE43_06480 [Serpentinimonas sp.]|jgi:hypothetical protein|nr:hypothetical protein [Serpentinimonas sp.]